MKKILKTQLNSIKIISLLSNKKIVSKLYFSSNNIDESKINFQPLEYNYDSYNNKLKNVIDNEISCEKSVNQTAQIKEKLEAIDLYNIVADKSKLKNTEGNRTYGLRDLSYSDAPEFSNEYKNKIAMEQYKYTMPIGWGWCYPLIKYTSGVLISIQAYTNLSWLVFFVMCGVSIRLILLPFNIKQIMYFNNLSKVMPNIKKLSYATLKCNLPLSLKIFYFVKAIFVYLKDTNIRPFLFFAYNFFQIPLFFCMILSIRKICTENNFLNEGILWFKNLSEPDPYMILPIISSIITFYNLGVRNIIFDYYIT